MTCKGREKELRYPELGQHIPSSEKGKMIPKFDEAWDSEANRLFRECWLEVIKRSNAYEVASEEQREKVLEYGAAAFAKHQKNWFEQRALQKAAALRKQREGSGQQPVMAVHTVDAKGSAWSLTTHRIAGHRNGRRATSTLRYSDRCCPAEGTGPSGEERDPT